MLPLMQNNTNQNAKKKSLNNFWICSLNINVHLTRRCLLTLDVAYYWPDPLLTLSKRTGVFLISTKPEMLNGSSNCGCEKYSFGGRFTFWHAQNEEGDGEFPRAVLVKPVLNATHQQAHII